MRKLALLLVLLLFSLPSIAQEDEPTPYEIALQRIQEAEASRTIHLNLSELGLTELPPEIGNLAYLQDLLLSYNYLHELPPEMGNLTNLQRLYLNGNQLVSLPSEIGNLDNLQILNLRDNQLASLPPEISHLNALRILDLRDNQIQHLPAELSLSESLKGENCGIYLEGNPLISPPQEVIDQGTSAILDYLENEAWWHLQRLIIGAATGFGIVAAFILGMRWRNRGKKKRA
jgi:Leucine-rich repeat (LRR) protein